MTRYVYAIFDGNSYDIEATFDDPIEAIRLAINGKTVFVLDAISLEYYGCI